jgi:hypothetical protein
MNLSEFVIDHILLYLLVIVSGKVYDRTNFQEILPKLVFIETVNILVTGKLKVFTTIDS